MARHRKDSSSRRKPIAQGLEAREDIHRSLERLSVDHVDLIQLIRLASGRLDQAMGPGARWRRRRGARAGLRGSSASPATAGPSPPCTAAASCSSTSLRVMPFTFLFAQNERYRQAFDEVLATCRERKVAVQIIKSIAPDRGPRGRRTPRGTAARGGGRHRPAVHWILGLPDIFINTAGDLALLPRVLDAASRFARRPPDEEMEAMLGATRMTSLFGLPT